MKTGVNRVTVFLGLLLCLVLYTGIRIVSGIGQSGSQGEALPPWKIKHTGPRRQGIKSKELDSLASNDRVIEDQIPARVPIKVELEKHDVEPLLRNLEVKVTNTSEKPIYYLLLHIVLPDVISPRGYPIGFPLEYGRTELVNFNEPLTEQDLPIPPGGTWVFKVPENNLSAFEKMVSRNHISQAPIRKVQLAFELLNFGDKTGFSGRGGTAIPNPPAKTGKGKCIDREGDEGLNSYNKSPPIFLRLSNSQAVLTPASYEEPDHSFHKRPAKPDICCPGTSCERVKASTYGCLVSCADNIYIHDPIAIV